MDRFYMLWFNKVFIRLNHTLVFSIGWYIFIQSIKRYDIGVKGPKKDNMTRRKYYIYLYFIILDIIRIMQWGFFKIFHSVKRHQLATPMTDHHETWQECFKKVILQPGVWRAKSWIVTLVRASLERQQNGKKWQKR